MADDTPEWAKELLTEVRQVRADLTARMDRLEVGQTALRTDLMGRLDRLQDTVTAIRDDVVVNFARADRAEEHADSAGRLIRALSEEVSGMHRQIQRLQSDVRQLKGEP